MKILGIDPGARGAIALVDGLSVEVWDMPAFEVARGKGKRREIDVYGLGRIINELDFDACYFEKVGGMAGDGPAEAFQFGRSAGAAEAVVKLRGARFVFVTPPVWKKHHGLIRTAKDDSRRRASDLWPSAAERFSRKMDEGRAEAALIAEYGRNRTIGDVFA